MSKPTPIEIEWAIGKPKWDADFVQVAKIALRDFGDK